MAPQQAGPPAVQTVAKPCGTFLQDRGRKKLQRSAAGVSVCFVSSFQSCDSVLDYFFVKYVNLQLANSLSSAQLLCNFRVEDLNSTIPSLDEETKTDIHNHIIQNLKGKKKVALGKITTFTI